MIKINNKNSEKETKMGTDFAYKGAGTYFRLYESFLDAHQSQPIYPPVAGAGDGWA